MRSPLLPTITALDKVMGTWEASTVWVECGGHCTAKNTVNAERLASPFFAVLLRFWKK